MKTITNLLLGFVLLLTSFSVYGADLEKERAAILEIDKQWAKAAAEARDVDRIVSFWSDDASVFAPGMPVMIGREAIRQFVQQSLATPGFSIRWTTTKVEFSKDGSLAYAFGTNLTTMDSPEGKKISTQGKSVTVWRKDSSGIWKCIIDIWNDDASAQP